jgi:uncharacterized protein (DUF1501 family)
MRSTATSAISRRQLLQAGALGTAGLSLAQLLRAEAAFGAGASRRVPARNCILVFLEGGPAHQDLWDLKPDAPAEVRGEFRPIATSAPGVLVCEHLDLLARQMHRVALVRSVHHGVNDHNAGAYYALTGRSPVVGGRLVVHDEPDNFPPLGAVLARLRPSERRLPPFVHLPDVMSNNGYDLPGQRAGFLGPRFDPLVAGDPSVERFEPAGLALPDSVSGERLAARRALASCLAAGTGSLPSKMHRLDAGGTATSAWDEHCDRAYSLLDSSDTRRAFDVAAEPLQLRERYGLPDRVDRSVEARQFGGLPHLGQSMLLARRLVEAGVRLVTVCTGRRYDQAWDTHRRHFPLLKQSLLPYFNRAFSALLEDLDQRGLLAETLVVALGEFGRTPRLGQITSGAGADAAGRDHWPHCYSVLLAGGPVRGGAIYGRSDRFAAYPAADAVTPEDIAATIYQALGIAAETTLVDPLGRPQAVATGRPLGEILG